jgi:drug/metabolite transporter (DMT)-like permease
MLHLQTWRQSGNIKRMQSFVVGVVLFAALIHASWNALVKTASDTVLTTVTVTTAAALLAACCLPFLPAPAPASWPYIAASVLLQLTYYTLLVRAYRGGDMSHTYPIMRGTAPLIVATLSAPLVGEHLSIARWVGIAMISAGVLGLAIHRSSSSAPQRAATAFALANAFAIAAYTLVDGLGVRKSGAALSYTLWMFFTVGSIRLGWVLLWRRREWLQYARGSWLHGIAGGSGMVSAYGLALWAMTVAPVALVSAFRETSIVFATGISALVLKERVTPMRVSCALVIAAGAALLAAYRR